MIVHAINCGWMRPLGGRLWDPETTGVGPAHLACRCLVIEHRDGLVLVDTGFGTRDVENPWARLSAVTVLGNRPARDHGLTARARLRFLGLDPAEVRHVVMTHLDFDHAGGLTDFPAARVHAHPVEILAARERKGPKARMRWRPEQLAVNIEAVPDLAGDWFGFTARRSEGLPSGIRLVELPGHSDGHCGVLIETGEGWVLHVGDAVFMHAELDDGAAAPVLSKGYEMAMQVDGEARRATAGRLRELKARHGAEVTMLCTHDPRAPAAATARVRFPDGLNFAR
ncbi:MAG: MBL fold metallo-hydrolase [Acetobacteraceae bacterium]|nr:MBL fold metallo-hydrolase [Acetobacteraceae bacterium]